MKKILLTSFVIILWFNIIIFSKFSYALENNETNNVLKTEGFEEDEFSSSDYLNTQDIPDVLEPYNRVMFGINKSLNNILITPITKIYQTIIPLRGREMVHNFLTNLIEPVNFINFTLQGKQDEASQTARRFLFNSTWGVLGLMDIAGDSGIPRRAAWFGQTLKVYGMDSGPFIILPILGPSTLRDTVGITVDYFIDPFFYLLSSDARRIRFGLYVIDTKDQYGRFQSDINELSLDEYAAVRSLYIQKYR